MTRRQPRTIDPRPSDVMPVQPRHVADAPSRSDLGRRAAGVGAIGFATLVIAQNVLRASAPQPGADLDEVVTYFSDHRTVTVVLLTTFIASLACLTMFIGGTLRQLLDSRRRGWAIFGWVGASSIIALFASKAGQASDPEQNFTLWLMGVDEAVEHANEAIGVGHRVAGERHRVGRRPFDLTKRARHFRNGHVAKAHRDAVRVGARRRRLLRRGHRLPGAVLDSAACLHQRQHADN